MKRTHLLTLLLLLLVVACGPSEEPTPVPDDVTTPAEQAYPAPTEVIAPTSEIEAYPPPTTVLPTIDAYPPPTLPPAEPEAYPPLKPTPNEAKRFLIDPVRIGAEMVTGTGLPDTAIRIISISYAGEELGFGQTAADRSFEVRLNRPLRDEVIGISPANSSQVSQLLDAPGTDIPMIGLVLDQRVVEP